MIRTPLIPNRLWQHVRRVRNIAHERLALIKAGIRLAFPRQGRSHGLDGNLVVSLTSYPPRYSTLHMTLACLLDQSVKADRTILWVARDDMSLLPDAVRRLEVGGLEIRGCDDLRSYKKLIPALEAYPDAYIVTADDDVYYGPDWLETLVRKVDPAAPAVLCHRAHGVAATTGGKLAPYLDWEFDVQDESARMPSGDIVGTGAGGVLYPPHALHPMVSDRALFQRLCPHGDDLWFYWCARMAGTPYQKVGGSMRVITWRGSQETALWDANQSGGNDRMIRALEAEFGPVLRQESNARRRISRK